jgi:hypothetical protein
VTGSARRVGRESLLSIPDCGAGVVVHHNESETAVTATAEEVCE